jgi:hypothetical protein
MASGKRKRVEPEQSCKRLKLGLRTPEPRWGTPPFDDFQGSDHESVNQQPSSFKEDLEEQRIRDLDEAVVALIEEEQRQEHGPIAMRVKRGEVHLINLEEECPIKPVPGQASRYEDIILFLLEDRMPGLFTLNGGEDQEAKAKVLKKYQNWKTKVLYRYYIDDAGTEHSDSHLRQLNSKGGWSQVPFKREIRSLCERVHGQDPNHLASKPMHRKLKEFNLLWHNMSADVTRSIKNCTRCMARRRSSDRIVKTNHTIPCKRPFERFQADLQFLKEEHGAVPPYKYLLVIVDYFSRFAWVVPIARKLASLVSDEFTSLLSELPHQPSIVQTDNGGEFRSSFDQLLLAEGIHPQQTWASSNEWCSRKTEQDHIRQTY